jgi:hypothetical protein
VASLLDGDDDLGLLRTTCVTDVDLGDWVKSSRSGLLGERQLDERALSFFVPMVLVVAVLDALESNGETLPQLETELSPTLLPMARQPLPLFATTAFAGRGERPERVAPAHFLARVVPMLLRGAVFLNVAPALSSSPLPRLCSSCSSSWGWKMGSADGNVLGVRCPIDDGAGDGCCFNMGVRCASNVDDDGDGCLSLLRSLLGVVRPGGDDDDDGRGAGDACFSAAETGDDFGCISVSSGSDLGLWRIVLVDTVAARGDCCCVGGDDSRSSSKGRRSMGQPERATVPLFLDTVTPTATGDGWLDFLFSKGETLLLFVEAAQMSGTTPALAASPVGLGERPERAPPPFLVDDDDDVPMLVLWSPWMLLLVWEDFLFGNGDNTALEKEPVEVMVLLAVLVVEPSVDELDVVSIVAATGEWQRMPCTNTGPPPPRLLSWVLAW